jgi:hypothetical protein
VRTRHGLGPRAIGHGPKKRPTLCGESA